MKKLSNSSGPSIFMISMLLANIQIFSNFYFDINNNQEQNWLNNEDNLEETLEVLAEAEDDADSRVSDRAAELLEQLKPPE